MGVPGDLPRHISHASHELLVELCVLLDGTVALKKTWDISLNQSVADGYGVRVTAAKDTMPAMMQFTKCSLKRGLPCACQGSFESTIPRGSRSVGIWRSDH